MEHFLRKFPPPPKKINATYFNKLYKHHSKKSQILGFDPPESEFMEKNSSENWRIREDIP